MGTMWHVNSELEALCQSIDTAELGRRIRRARRAAGLTQSEVAGEDVSTAYISRIEDGQRRPDLRLVERMAARMGVPVEELLLGMSADELRELQYLVDQAELELVSGDAATALASANRALGALVGARGTQPRRAARRVRAAALEAVGDVDAAIDELQDLAGDPTPDAAWLKGLIALSRCYREKGDLDRAIAVGADAADTIARLGISATTEAIQLTVTVAFAHMYRGDEAHALRLCKRAIADAEELDLPIAKASAYWNASIIQARRGAMDQAIFLAMEALALFEEGDDVRNIARLRAQVGLLKLLTDPPDAFGSLEILSRAERELAWSPATAFDRANVLETSSRAYFLLGNHEQALEQLRRCAETAPVDSPRLQACSFALRGRIAAAENRIDEARLHYQAAALTLTGMGADHDAAQLWFDLGALLADIGDVDDARDAFKRAAVSKGLRPTPIRSVPLG